MTRASGSLFCILPSVQEKLLDIIDARGSQAAKYGISSSGPYGTSCAVAAILSRLHVAWVQEVVWKPKLEE